MKTFEQIEAAAEMLASYRKNSTYQKTAAYQAKQTDVWAVVIPLLQALANLWFLPRKWKRVITLVLDSVQETFGSNSVNEI